MKPGRVMCVLALFIGLEASEGAQQVKAAYPSKVVARLKTV